MTANDLYHQWVDATNTSNPTSAFAAGYLAALSQAREEIETKIGWDPDPDDGRDLGRFGAAQDALEILDALIKDGTGIQE